MLTAPQKSAAARAQDASKADKSQGTFWRLKGREFGEALAMWSDGFDTADIATELGVHQSVIHNEIGKR
jgi:hypothetical protein